MKLLYHHRPPRKPSQIVISTIGWVVLWFVLAFASVGMWTLLALLV